MIERVRHGRVELAVHRLEEGTGPTLLCLHELEGRGEDWRAAVQGWSGPAVAVDLAGHGDSQWLAGGGYTPEMFAADADVALASIPGEGPVAVIGAGIGAYAALLLAGSRPERVEVAALLPGRGLAGGGAEPGDRPFDERMGHTLLDLADRSADTTVATDPLVRLCLTDLRPTDYAAFFAASARRLVLGEDGEDRPPWWLEVRTSSRSTVGPSDPGALVGWLAAG